MQPRTKRFNWPISWLNRFRGLREIVAQSWKVCRLPAPPKFRLRTWFLGQEKKISLKASMKSSSSNFQRNWIKFGPFEKNRWMRSMTLSLCHVCDVHTNRFFTSNIVFCTFFLSQNWNFTVKLFGRKFNFTGNLGAYGVFLIQKKFGCDLSHSLWVGDFWSL